LIGAAVVVAAVVLCGCEPFHPDESSDDWRRRHEFDAAVRSASPPAGARSASVGPRRRLDEARRAECRAVAEATRFAFEYEIHAARGSDRWNQEEWDTDLEEGLTAVPPDLRAEVEAVRLGARAYAHEIDDYLHRVLVDVEGQFVRAEEALRTPEVRVALGAIEGFLGACPSW
jgi:hypothetical protein